MCAYFTKASTRSARGGLGALEWACAHFTKASTRSARSGLGALEWACAYFTKASTLGAPAALGAGLGALEWACAAHSLETTQNAGGSPSGRLCPPRSMRNGWFRAVSRDHPKRRRVPSGGSLSAPVNA